MKLLVLSDSHGNLANAVAAVAETEPDMILHLGDGWDDARELSLAYPDIPLEQVPGNCDFRMGEPQEKLLLVEGHRIFCCHGHTRGVKQGCGAAIAEAKRQGAELLLFGHTHRSDWGREGALQWMNPGSVGDWRRPSYGLVEVHPGGELVCRRCFLDE